jgi:hypothetical protein
MPDFAKTLGRDMANRQADYKQKGVPRTGGSIAEFAFLHCNML